MLQNRGCELLYLGDFNAHYKKNNKSPQPQDGNAKRISKLNDELHLNIMNFSQKCEGEYTWCKKNSKTMVDYVITNENMNSNVTKMTIDDKG